MRRISSHGNFTTGQSLAAPQSYQSRGESSSSSVTQKSSATLRKVSSCRDFAIRRSSEGSGNLIDAAQKKIQQKPDDLSSDIKNFDFQLLKHYQIHRIIDDIAKQTKSLEIRLSKYMNSSKDQVINDLFFTDPYFEPESLYCYTCSLNSIVKDLDQEVNRLSINQLLTEKLMADVDLAYKKHALALDWLRLLSSISQEPKKPLVIPSDSSCHSRPSEKSEKDFFAIHKFFSNPDRSRPLNAYRWSREGEMLSRKPSLILGDSSCYSGSSEKDEKVSSVVQKMFSDSNRSKPLNAYSWLHEGKPFLM